MAAVLYELKGGKDREALEFNKKAIKIDPLNAKIAWNLSLSQLRNGFLKEGLLGYEKRFNWEDFPSPIRKFTTPKIGTPV